LSLDYIGMQHEQLEELAGIFLALFAEGRLIAQPTHPIQSMSLEDAYRVQAAVIRRRIENNERVVGYKVGCTSKAIRDQFGLTEPICGRLMEPQLHHGDTDLGFSEFTNCAVEPEFAFRMGKDVRSHELSDAHLTQMIGFVSPAVEVHNYKFWFGAPSSQELIASNGIHACLVTGDDRVDIKSIDLAQSEMSLFVSDELKASARGSEIMGGPLVSLRWLIKHLEAEGEYLREGQWVIPGSPVQLISVSRGDCARATLSGIGSVKVCFV